MPEERTIATARQALAEGKPLVADAITTSLLNRNPENAEALFIRALLLRGTGRLEEAADVSAAAWRHAQSPLLRFEAAMLTADILARQERYMISRFWLRRADQAAPDDTRRAEAARAFRIVRQRDPLQVRLHFSVTPSNNVNDGAETLLIDIGGLPFRLDPSDGQLGGIEASAGVSLAYKLSESPTGRTDLLGDLYYRKVWLDSDAATIAPGVEDSDFDFGAVVAGIRHQRLIWPELGPTSVTGLVGQSWYGGKKLSRWTEILTSQTVRRSDTSSLRFGVQARFERRYDDDIADYNAFGVSAEFLKGLGADGSYSLGLWVRDYASDSATVDAFAIGANAARAFGQIGPVVPRVSLQAEDRDYRKWTATPGGRKDHTLGLQLDLIWPDISYYGFVPQTSLTARRTWSDVDIYDRNEVSLGFSVVSRF